jgi:hypothetical protein
VENFKERNADMIRKRKLKYRKVIVDEEIRHENNLLKLNIENKKISKENEKKYFKKYVSFYWQRKKKENELKKRKKEIIDKLSEKNEKIFLLEKMNEIKRKDILKKIQTWDLRKKEGEKIKSKKFLDSKKKRELRFKSCEQKRNEFLLEESERRRDILDYQSETFIRSLSRDNIFLMKRNNAHEKTSQDQIILEKNLMSFNKQMNRLKSQSMLKKSFKEKLKIFRELKRKEEEQKKKEMEDKLV